LQLFLLAFKQQQTIRKICDIMLKAWTEFVSQKALPFLSREEREILEDQKMMR
jgi:hypothetical protein